VKHRKGKDPGLNEKPQEKKTMGKVEWECRRSGAGQKVDQIKKVEGKHRTWGCNQIGCRVGKKKHTTRCLLRCARTPNPVEKEPEQTSGGKGGKDQAIHPGSDRNKQRIRCLNDKKYLVLIAIRLEHWPCAKMGWDTRVGGECRPWVTYRGTPSGTPKTICKGDAMAKGRKRGSDEARG